METVGIVTARGGSKGIPQKNIKPLAGKPLIAWTIEAALNSSLSRVIVSTDDPEIAEVSRRFGAEVPFLRPPELARDDSPHTTAIAHALTWLAEHEQFSPRYSVLLQPTSPLRTALDIDAALELAAARQAPAVVSVRETGDHPHLTMSISPHGTLQAFVDTNLKYPRRQDLPPAYMFNGAVYVQCCQTFLRKPIMRPPGTVAYVMPQSRSLDIDSLWDFHLADLILRDQLSRPTDERKAA